MIGTGTLFRRIPKLLILIFLLALLLRTIALDSFPVGFHSDEARVAWNSLSILKTGFDDSGQKFALYYNTFGDFRPTGIFYFTIPSLMIFGRNEFAVRFPSALFGALTIFPLFLFVLEMLTDKTKIGSNLARPLALFSALFLAISPWHIEVSRATSEVAISTFFALFSLYFSIKLIKGEGWKFAVLSCLAILVSYLLYHSIRFLAPLFFLTIILYHFKKIRNSKLEKYVLASLVFVFLLTLFFNNTSEAKKRFDQVSIFNDEDTNYEINRLQSENLKPNLATFIFDNQNVVFFRRFLSEYTEYFSGNFLTGDSAKPYRYAVPGAGILTYVELSLLVVGLLEIIKRKKNPLPLFLLLIAPLPAALTTEDTPNLHRAFFMVIFFVIIESYGLAALLQIKKIKFIKPVVFSLITLNFLFFLHMYFTHAFFHKPFIQNYPLDGSSYRNVGAKELALKLGELQSKYDKIILSNTPDNFYPWYAFFTGKDPQEFNNYAIKRKDGPWQYQNILFSDSQCPSGSFFQTDRANKLLVVDAGEPTCAYNAWINDGFKAKVVDKILRPNGSEVYVLLDRK